MIDMKSFEGLKVLFCTINFFAACDAKLDLKFMLVLFFNCSAVLVGCLP